jgi:hypothetical protein
MRSGSFLVVGNGTVLDRIQTGGPGALNTPNEQIYEVGNFKSVGRVYDTPDLTYDVESLDVSTEFESKLLDAVPHAVPGDSTVGSLHEFDLSTYKPIDIVSPMKFDRGNYSIYNGIITPYLYLDSVTYRYGVRQNATQTFSLKGDSVYYTEGNPFYEEFVYDGSSNATKSFTFPGATGASAATEYVEQGESVYAYCVTILNSTTGEVKRLFHGEDYTDDDSGFTITAAHSGFDKIRVCYAGDGTLEYPQTVHQNVSVKPAAVRGKDIKVRLGSTDATPVFSNVRGAQTAEATQRFNISVDEELGNHHAVGQDFDVPEVTGSISLKPIGVESFFDHLHKITGVADGQTIGPSLTALIPLEIQILDPDASGDVLKTIYIPDARFDVPGVTARANAKIDGVALNYSSDSGTMLVYDGAR